MVFVTKVKKFKVSVPICQIGISEIVVMISVLTRLEFQTSYMSCSTWVHSLGDYINIVFATKVEQFEVSVPICQIEIFEIDVMISVYTR